MTWTLTVDGIDRSANLRPLKTFRLSGRLGRKTLSFRLLDEDGTLAVEPQVVVRVEHDAVELFEGRVKRRTYSRLGSTAARWIDVRCVDYNVLLEEDVIDVAFRTVEESDKERITWLVQTFGTKGVTAGAEVQELLAAMPGGSDGRPEQDFSGKTLGVAIAQVAKISGGQLYVDDDKRLHHFVTEAIAAPFAISDVPDGVTSVRSRNFTLTEDSVDLVHRVLVRGTGVSVTREVAVLPPPDQIVSAVITDDEIASVAQANVAGDAFLAAYGVPRREGSLEILVPGIQPGMTVQATNALYGLVNEPFHVTGVDVSIESSALVRYRLDLDTAPDDLASLFGDTSRAVVAARGSALSAVESLVDLSVAGANMVPNSSFESASTTGWTVGGGWVFGFDPVAPQEAFRGSRVARATAAAADVAALDTPFIAVARSDDWWVSAWSFMRAYTSGTARITLREFDAAQAFLQERTIADLTAVQAEWTRHSLHLGPNDQLGRTAFHASTAFVRLRLDGVGVGTFTWDVDGIQVERGKLFTAYAPSPQELVDQQVGTTQIADDAVTTSKVVANAIVAGKIAASAVTADKIAAAAVTADKLMVGGGALLNNPDFEVGAQGVANVIPGWVVVAVAPGFCQLYGLDPSTTGLGGVQCCDLNMTLGGSVTLSQVVLAAPGEIFYLSARMKDTAGSAGDILIAFDFWTAAGAFISTSSANVVPTTSWERWSFKSTAAPAGTGQVVVRIVSAWGGHKIDDVWFSRSGDLVNSDGHVLINHSGITVTNGKITVQNPAGTVVIDGTSNMFKVAATGTHSATVGAGPRAQVTSSITLVALGALPTTPAHLTYLSAGNAVGSTQHLGYFQGGYAAKWISGALNGANNQERNIPDHIGEAITQLDGSSQAIHRISARSDGVGWTLFGRYYILKEAAL